MAEVEAKADIPVDDIKLLIDMIRGAVPFDLVTAVKAGLSVANYILGLLGNATTASVAAESSDEDLACALETLLPGGDVSKAGLFDGTRRPVLEALLKMVITWLAGQMTK